MSPRVERPRHPYVQIAGHYRKLIADGSLQPGARLPAVNTIAEEWDVSPGTAHKAIRQLAGEKLVEPTQQGTWVLDHAEPASLVGLLRKAQREIDDTAFNLGANGSTSEQRQTLADTLTQLAELLRSTHDTPTVTDTGDRTPTQ